MRITFRIKNFLVSFIFLAFSTFAFGQLDNYKSSTQKGSGWVLESQSGQKVFIRPYGNYMVRLQFAKPNQNFFPDNHYDIIVNHKMGGSLKLTELSDKLILESSAVGGIRLEVQKKPLRFSFYNNKTNQLLLRDKDGIVWSDASIKSDFEPVANEHILGFGQKPLGYQKSIDLMGERTRRNYGEDGIAGRGSQGNLLVPFYMSSKGYGLYMNSMFPNDFSFNNEGKYFVSFETKGAEAQMDLVFILGPDFGSMLNRYTQLTGRPRMIPKSMFGLNLSDNDPWINNKPIDQSWWETMITNHRNAGFPLDHIVFDNDWRKGAGPNGEGAGQWGGSKFEFNPERFADPTTFAAFLKKNGLTVTLDLNLNNCNDSWGWKPEYNLPIDTACHDNNSNSYPDYSNPKVRNWVWELFWNKALNPALKYPGDGLWIDESDGVYSSCVPFKTIVNNGKCWGEMKNYYYFLMGKAIVEEGWSNDKGMRKNFIGENKRPFVWIRGGTAGGQRFGTHWTGDIHFTPYAYHSQIKAMQASGLAAYPYFNHDAGGFVEKTPGPNDSTYIQWAMAFGSFTPIWRPHGYGQPRWPLNRSTASQAAALKYGTLRYELMPYIYTMAHIANQTGMPMARTMSIVYPDQEAAWKNELQYMWGSEMLVAPGLSLSGIDSIQNVWLPKGNDWYSFWNDTKMKGNQTIKHNAKYGELPIFVKSGAIIPRQQFAKSTFWLSDKHLILDVYVGANGKFTLIEDDGVSEKYNTKKEIRKTTIKYDDTSKMLSILPATGTYSGATTSRDYLVRIHGLDKCDKVLLNNKVLTNNASLDKNECFKFEKGIVVVKSNEYSVLQKIILKFL